MAYTVRFAGPRVVVTQHTGKEEVIKVLSSSQSARLFGKGWIASKIFFRWGQ
jgi:hypothetical protein